MKQLKLMQKEWILRTFKVIFVVAATWSFFGCGGEVPLGFDPNFRLIIPQTDPVAGDTHIDGDNNAASDPKWVDAFNIQLINGVPVANNNFWGVADGTYFYLYFATTVDQFSQLDALVLALSPTSSPTQKHLLVINPCSTTSQCLNSLTNITPTIIYYTDPDGDNTYTASADPHNVLTRAYASAAGAGGIWALEVRIPRGAPFNLPGTGFFGLFASVLDYDLFGTNVFQYTWPFNNGAGTTLLSGSIAPGSTNAIPLQAHWGNASLDSSLPTGVSISSQDISTNHGSSIISINQPNIFTAIAHNQGTTIAQDIKADFQLANFGLPAFGSWESIGISSVLSINPTASQNYTLNWSVPPDRVPDYTTHDHQCIRVQLSSTNPQTTFINSSAQRNMDFVVTSSPFTSKPAIATAGYHLAEQMRQEEFIIRERFYNYKPDLKWESKIEGAQKVKDNLYQLTIPIKESKDIGLAVQPPEQSLVAFEKLVIPPIKEDQEGQQSDIIKLKVAAGTLISLVPNRQVKNAGAPPTTHMTARDAANSTREATLLAGTVLASWDGFSNSSFVVSPGTSLIAPKGAESLYLRQQLSKGDGRIAAEQPINIYVTDMLDLPRHLQSSVNFARDQFGFVGIGANLPTAVYFGYRKANKTLEVNGKPFNVYETAGSFGYLVKGQKADQ
jgi:hypothetical protein